jgi:hypothetical protein
MVPPFFPGTTVGIAWKDERTATERFGTLGLLAQMHCEKLRT